MDTYVLVEMNLGRLCYDSSVSPSSTLDGADMRFMWRLKLSKTDTPSHYDAVAVAFQKICASSGES